MALVYDAHVREVYRFVFRRCRDHSLAEDITQETFLRAATGPADPSTLSVGWLLTVARNQLVDVLRRHSRFEDKLRLIVAGSNDAEEVDPVERLRVEAALGQMNIDRRLVLTLHYIDGLPVRELAELMDRTPRAVESLMARARQELRELLDEPLEATAERDVNG